MHARKKYKLFLETKRAMEEVPFDSIDVSEWPVVYINLQRPPKDDSEIEGFQARLCAMLALAIDGSERVAPCKLFMMMNLNGIVGATFHQQMKAAELIANVRDYAKRGIVRTSLIVSDELVRLVFEVIVRIQPLQSKHEIFETYDRAREWLLQERKAWLLEAQ